MTLLAFIPAGCDLGSADRALPPTTHETVEVDAASAVTSHRPAILRALARDVACTAPRCSTPAGLRERADAVAAAVTPLDDAFARERTLDAKRRRAVTSALLHAAEEMRTCFKLSARKHGGVPSDFDCMGPIERFRAAVPLVRTAVASDGA